ncbi:Uncharacterized protein TCM_045250 [Theobroma cacao]|uniref:Retrotransposon Copia-like N-terminal domain-containing protein n=1 Tax=Theobroma cacao TaxID=3641 RepID=A0A061FS02_THECC|nr:Uncharacterized protein TCM_045250 [Theobroma cacao]
MAPKIAAVSLNPEIIIPETTYLDNGLVYISDAAQHSGKLTYKNYWTWQAQFKALLNGFDLLGYVDGSKQCPPATVMKNNQAASNPDYVLWYRQDQLVLHAILTCISQEDLLYKLVAKRTGVETAEAAWNMISRILEH